MGLCKSSELDHYAVGQAKAGIRAREEADAAAAAMLEDKGLSIHVELSIRCEGLKNKDGGLWGTSDPMVVVYMNRYGAWEEIARTEVVANSVNPQFVRLIPMDYRFEQVQLIGFKVYDVDSNFSNTASEQLDLSKQDYLGEMTCALPEIMGGQCSTLRRHLNYRNHPANGRDGTIIVTGEEVANQSNVLRAQFKACNLPKKDKFGSSNPFLVVSRIRGGFGSSKIPVFKSEVLSKTREPTWQISDIPLNSLCNQDLNRSIFIECFYWNPDGGHECIGVCETSVAQLLQLGSEVAVQSNQNQLPFTGSDNQRKAKHHSCTLVVGRCEIVEGPSFLDFIRGGCKMNFMVAIDLTASNLPPYKPESLHYMDPIGNKLNPYQKAIVAVGEVLQFYDSDKRYPLWGFGGKVAGGQANHCFALNGDDAHPEVCGVDGLLSTYAFAIRNLELSGPTIFSHVTATAAAIAKSAEDMMSQDQQQYFVLLIITDGIINDMDHTISTLIGASTLPLSVIIVGVGETDFTAMKILDGDDTPLQNHTGIATRDFVQFVAMRDFRDDSADVSTTKLSRCLLDEIPGQLLSYFNSKAIKPNPPPMPPSFVSELKFSGLSISSANCGPISQGPLAPMMVAPSPRYEHKHESYQSPFAASPL